MGFRNPVNSISGDQITPGTITGSTLQTAAAGRRVVISANQVDPLGVRMFSGDPGESAPGTLSSDVELAPLYTPGDQGKFVITASRLGVAGDAAALTLYGASRDGLTPARAFLHAASTSIEGSLTVGTAVTVFGSPTWNAPVLLHSWTNYNPATNRSAGYLKMADGTIMLRGLVKGGAQGSILFQLPPSCCPTQLEAFLCSAGIGAARMEVDVNGNVSLNNFNTGGSNGYLSLTGIRFSYLN